MRPFGKPWSARAFSLFTVLRQVDARSDPSFPVWAKQVQRRFKKEEKPCCIDRYNLPPERISAGGESSLCPWRQQGLSRLLFRYWPALLLWRAKANNPFGQKEPSASKCLRLEGSNFRLGGIAPIIRAVPSFRFPMHLAVSVAWQKGN